MIPTKLFGRTGHASSRVIFGGAALWQANQEQADRTLNLLLEYGINHIDTAPSYGDSELHIGPWMEQHRDDFFLATKTGERTYQKARDEIHASLERLRVDYVDLLQLHHLVDVEEWETAMRPGGALQAALEAREQGLVRFIGVTGHGLTTPKMHRQSLEYFDFESVLLPYSYMLMQNADYAAEFQTLLEFCQTHNIAVQTIKSIVRRPWGDRPQTRTTWYEPLEDQAAIDKAVHWVLGQPSVFLISVGDMDVLPKVLEAASRFEARPLEVEMRALLSDQAIKPLFE